jgi:hypothetical protein
LEAGWVYKEGRERKKWVFGYRLHLVVDANHEFPINKRLTTFKIQDPQMMLPLLREAKDKLPWFVPAAVIGDKGYDSGDNFRGIVEEFDADPIIPLSPKTKEPVPEITGSSAAPYCTAGLSLVYRSWDRNKGMQYECPERAGKAYCPLLLKCGLKTVWVRPVRDYRRFGHRIKRGTDEWKELSYKRVAIEHVNSRLKETRRLEAHCFRGFDRVNTHTTLSILVMQAVALAKAKAGQLNEIRVCVRQVG